MPSFLNAHAYFLLKPLGLALMTLPAFAATKPASAADNLPAPAISLEANEVDGNINEKIHAKGDVQLKRGNECVRADWIEYFPQNQSIKAGEHVQITRGKDKITGKNLEYQFLPEQGVLHDAQIEMQSQQLRLDSQKAQIHEAGRYSLENARATLCPPGRDDWYIRADQLDIHMAKNEGIARGGRFEFFGTPLFYAPYLSFPVSSERKSGLLAPTIASRSSSGVDLSLPYYFNLAPEYDLTLIPRIISKRGAMLGGEFRYLQPTFRGKLEAEYLPNDRQTGETRHAFSFRHEHKLAPNLVFQGFAHRVSDDNYFRHFGNRSSFADNVHLPRQAALIWQPSTHSGGQIFVQRYQTLQDQNMRVEEPYARLPQITFFHRQALPLGLQAHFDSEYVEFAHRHRQEGQRLSLTGSLSLPWQNSFAFFKPKLAVNYRHYQLNEWQGQASRSKEVTTPTFSLDTGLHFERASHYFGQSAIQTLEPRLFYVRTPYRNQQDLPLFDTSENSFDFAQIFAENRFSGGDRLGDANTLTAALTSRFINQQDGEERLRVSIAQRYSFGDQRVTFSGLPDERKKSDFLASVGGNIWQDVWLNGTYQYNPELKKTRRYAVDLRYQPAPGKTLSARYRYGHDEVILNPDSSLQKRDSLRQVDLAMQWPVAKNWYVIARENYSLRDRKPLEHLLGVEYHRDCWSLRLVGQHYASSAIDTTTNVFLQLELTGLGGVGSNPMETLRLAIPGYSKINDTPRFNKH